MARLSPACLDNPKEATKTKTKKPLGSNNSATLQDTRSTYKNQLGVNILMNTRKLKLKTQCHL